MASTPDFQAGSSIKAFSSIASTLDFQTGLKILEDITTNVAQVQHQVLDEILKRNANTEYLCRFLNGHSDKELFKQKVPVVEYEDISPSTDRIANGEPSNILLDEPISEFLLSSGTSGGKRKLMPSTAKYMDMKFVSTQLVNLVMIKHAEGLTQGKWMNFYFMKPDFETPSGLTATTFMSSLIKIIQQKYPQNKIYTSPDDIIRCLDSNQSMYCQLLCGLIQRDNVVTTGAAFASTFLVVINFLEDHWKELCSNIRTGHLSDWITDPGCRDSVKLIMSEPNLELANLIEQVCSAKSWEGIVKKLWPRTKYIGAIVTGSMAQYIPTLNFYSGGLPLVSLVYGSSECFFGINLNPLCQPSDISYTILPNMAYFEFIPVDTSNGAVCTGKENIVDLANVKVGQFYEIVSTTNTGIYRYRVGDIVKVTGFYNNAPQVQVVGRQSVALSVDIDKTTEKNLSKAVMQAQLHLEQLGFLLIDFTSYANTSSIPGHYVLYWELMMKESTSDVGELNSEMIEQCCSIIEESLDATYKIVRKENSAGPLEIRVGNRGTFDALMEFFIAGGSSLSQYKTPRCIKSEEAIKLLDSRVVGRYFSPKTPHLLPDEI
ncbi:hypothetical protein SLA2020_201520 [Shorea laevis]